jgi:glutamate--cysteine ligase
MPSVRRALTTASVRQVSEAMFAPSETEYFGVELEWPVHRRGDVATRPTQAEIKQLEGCPLPAAGRVTFEPGGQVELSTAPARSVPQALAATELDVRALHAHMAASGFVCETLALDARRRPRRVLERPRYEAMERFFGEQDPAGKWMMCNTASTQINISHDRLDPRQRWHTLHLIGPVLIAAFANSPGLDTRGRHWESLRQAIWWSIDPARTRPVRTDLDPDAAWLQYSLGADVMFINSEDTDAVGGIALRPGFTFARWMDEGHAAGWPTADDYRYHLSTLFPPIRPRGWLELRVLDALPDWIRDVAVLVVATACSSAASRELRRRLPDTSELWVDAARAGLSNQLLSRAAQVLLEVAGDHLGSITADSRHVDIVEEYAARYTRRQRSPGSEPASAAAPSTKHKAPALTCG